MCERAEKEPDARAHVNQLGWTGLAGVAVTGAGQGIDTAHEGLDSSLNLLQFLFSYKAGAGPAQYAVLLRVRHCMLLF